MVRGLACIFMHLLRYHEPSGSHLQERGGLNMVQGDIVDMSLWQAQLCTAEKRRPGAW